MPLDELLLPQEARREVTSRRSGHQDVRSCPHPVPEILESAEVSKASKRELEATYLTLNPAELRRRIGRCQDRLIELVKTKRERRKEVRRPPSTPRPAPWQDRRARERYEDIFHEATEGRFEDILT